MMPQKTELQRFWEKVHKTESCWLWTASKRNKGYGAFVYVRDGKVIQGRAHRYAYELHIGPIPERLHVLHNCPTGDNAACVNPAHLWVGTKAQNNADMVAKGRHVKGGTYLQTLNKGKYERGAAHHNARLTEQHIREIRTKYASGHTSFSTLAREYGVAIAHVYRIVQGKAWRHIT